MNNMSLLWVFAWSSVAVTPNATPSESTACFLRRSDMTGHDVQPEDLRTPRGLLCINKRHINILGALHMMIMMDTNWQEECVVSFVIGRRVEMFFCVAFSPTGLLIRYRPAVIIRQTFSMEDEWTSNALINVFFSACDTSLKALQFNYCKHCNLWWL